MMRLILMFICVLSLFLPHDNVANAQLNSAIVKINNYEGVIQKAVDEGGVRVIVRLDVPDLEILTSASTLIQSGDLSATASIRALTADLALASQITTIANGLLDSPAGTGLQVSHRYQTLPFISGTASANTLIALSENSSVLEIIEDIPVAPALDNTVHITGATTAWADGFSGSGWYVAILDNGIRSSHDFFAGKSIVEACRAMGEDGNTVAGGDCPDGTDSQDGAGSATHYASTYPGYDHGTHVAGIAAGSNTSGLNGVAPDADIIAVNVFSRFNNSSNCGGGDCVLSWTSDQLAGLEYIYSLRAVYDIAAVNMSIGGGLFQNFCDSDPRKSAIDNLRSAGIPTVIASGNNGSCGSVSMPGCISTAVTVGATNDADVEANFSNWNATLLDLFAPGVSINSSTGGSDSSYGSKSGTSMATPHVTGAFAVLRSVDPISPVSDLLNALRANGVDITSTQKGGCIITPAAPRIQIDAAADALLPPLPDPPSDLVASAISDSQINLVWTDNANNETGYRIERRMGAIGTYAEIATVTADTTTYLDTTGLAGFTTYYYRVRAYNSAGNSVYSPEASATIGLPAPTAFEAIAISATQIDLSWQDNASSETGFYVERSTTSGGGFSQIAVAAADATTYSDTVGLVDGTIYYYRIRAYNAGGNSAYTEEASAVTTLLSPTALEATVTSANQINLSWTDNSSSEDGFAIERSTTSGSGFSQFAFVSANITTIINGSLLNGTTYYYRVRAFNANGSSEYTAEASATIPLSAPNALEATAVSTSQIDLSWNDRSSGETGFFIERSTNSGSGFAQIATVTANTANYRDGTGLEDGTRYYYRVRAFNSRTHSTYTIEASAITILLAPTGLSAYVVSSSQIDLSWSDHSSSEAGYSIERSTRSGSGFSSIGTVVANTTRYRDTANLLEGTPYYYRIRAFNAGGNSSYTAEASAFTTLVAPSELWAVAVSDSQIDLSWHDGSSGESGFAIERSTTPGSGFRLMVTVAANTTRYSDDTDLVDSTRYYYRVSAYNSGGSSEYSAEASAFTTLMAPNRLEATVVSASQIDLSWSDNTSNESGFAIERSVTSGDQFTQIATVADNTTIYSDNAGLVDGTLYYYRVRALGSVGSSEYSADAIAHTSLLAPTEFVAITLSATQIDLSWRDNSLTETGFYIERSTTSGSAFVQIATLAADTTNYSDANLAESTTYYYRMRSWAAGGQQSAFSSEAIATTNAQNGSVNDGGGSGSGGGGCFIAVAGF